MEKKELRTPGAPKAIGPYSQGVIVGNLLFTSGQVPFIPETGAIVEGGVKEQAVQVFENIKALLEAAGASLSDIVKATVFLKDMNDFAAVNEVYASYIHDCILPARSAVEVSRLPKDVLLEIETITLLR